MKGQGEGEGRGGEKGGGKGGEGKAEGEREREQERRGEREEFAHFKLLYSYLILFMAGIQLSLLLHKLSLLCLPPLTTITILLVHNTL